MIALTQNTRQDRPWQMVEANQGLVWWMARKIYDSSSVRGFRGLELDDLVQEGFLGLQRAAEKFNPALGVSFGSYAPFWIRREMWRAITKQRIIRIPQEVRHELSELKKVMESYKHERGINPSVEVLADRLACSRERIVFLLTVQQEQDVQSFDQPVISGDEETPLSDLIAAPDHTPQQDERSVLAALLDYLLPQEREVIELRYQVGPQATHDLNDIPLPFAVVMRQMGIGLDKAQRLEAQAFMKMRYRAKMLALQEKTV